MKMNGQGPGDEELGGSPALAAYTADERLVQPVAIGPSELARTPSSASPSPPMSVWLTGTGTPAVLPGRSGPSNVMRSGGDLVVVDCGSGAAYQLARLGFEPSAVTHVFITHHHLDHNTDLPFLVLSPWIDSFGKSDPPAVVGPPGTRTFVERFLALHEYDLRVRIPHGFDPQRLKLSVVEVQDGSVLHGDGWAATAFRVDHAPVHEAFGYRFDAAAASVVFSGDTRPCSNLLQHAQGTDVLVHEALYPGYGIPEYHTLSTQVGRVATQAGVDRLVLTHLLPGHLSDEAWLEHVRKDYDGPVTVGSDLLQIL